MFFRRSLRPLSLFFLYKTQFTRRTPWFWFMKGFNSLHRRLKILERRIRDCSTVIVASPFVCHFYFLPFFTPCKLHLRFWVARLTDRNENQSWRVCNVENSTNENVFRFSLPPFPPAFPSPADSPIFFSVPESGLFIVPLSLLLSCFRFLPWHRFFALGCLENPLYARL